jgi:transcriptional regulator GlxA family with amidase domain
MRIAMLALPGAAITSIFGPLEILGLAAQLAKSHSSAAAAAAAGAGVEEGCSTIGITIVSETADARPAMAGVMFKSQPLADEPHYDWVLVSAAGHPGTKGFMFSPTLQDWIRTQHGVGARLASICTGAFLLAEAGILDRQEATTHWLFEKLFKDKYPAVRLRIDQLLTQGERVMCSGGAHAFLDLTLAIVVEIYGKDIANRCAKLLLLDRHRESQNVYAGFFTQRQHRDAKVLKIQQWLDEHYAESVQIEQLAANANLGERHFKRRFKAATGDSPLAYLQKLRIDSARTLLEQSTAPVEDIARAVGYEDPGFFRELFRRMTSQTPAQYRQHYR